MSLCRIRTIEITVNTVLKSIINLSERKLDSLNINKEQAMSKEQENKDEKDNKKEVAIIVNGKQREVAKKDLSFADVVTLAFDTPPTGENILFTITYRRGHGDKPEGTLIEGQSIKVKDGMIFNVTATDKS